MPIGLFTFVPDPNELGDNLFACSNCGCSTDYDHRSQTCHGCGRRMVSDG